MRMGRLPLLDGAKVGEAGRGGFALDQM